MINVSKIQ